MSKLQLMGRPFVVFDAHKEEHRQWFAEFNKRASWGHCPVRFVIDDDAGDLITMIQRRLVQYYIDKEFERVVKKQRTKRVLVAQKKPKKVDTKTK